MTRVKGTAAGGGPGNRRGRASPLRAPPRDRPVRVTGRLGRRRILLGILHLPRNTRDPAQSQSGHHRPHGCGPSCSPSSHPRMHAVPAAQSSPSAGPRGARRPHRRCYRAVDAAACRRRPRRRLGAAQKRGKDARVTATLASLPPIVQPGTSPAAPSDDGALVAHFAPAARARRSPSRSRAGGGWRSSRRPPRTPGAPPPSPPGAGTYRACTAAGGRTWTSGSVGPADGPPSSRTPSPAPPWTPRSGTTRSASTRRVRPPHLRPRRPRRAPRRRRRPPPRRRPRPARSPASPATTDRRAAPAPAPTCSPARSPPSTPASSSTASSPPASSRSAPRACTRLLDAPRAARVQRRRPRRGRRDRRHGVLRRDRPRPRVHRLARDYYGPGWRQGAASATSSPPPATRWAAAAATGGTSSTCSRSSGPRGVHLPRRRPRVLPRDQGRVPVPCSTSCCRYLTSDYELDELAADELGDTAAGRLGPGLRRHLARVGPRQPAAARPPDAGRTGPRLAACRACTPSSCCRTLPATSPYAVTGRPCATPACPPSSTTAAPPTART